MVAKMMRKSVAQMAMRKTAYSDAAAADRRMRGPRAEADGASPCKCSLRNERVMVERLPKSSTSEVSGENRLPKSQTSEVLSICESATTYFFASAPSRALRSAKK